MQLLVIFALLVSVFGFINSANAESYFCYGTKYIGDYAPDMKPGEAECEHLKYLTLPYSVCMENAAKSLSNLDLAKEAFDNGDCVPYQTKTMQYKTAACSAKFVSEKGKRALKIDTQFGTIEDREACYKELQESIKSDYPDLKNF